MNGREERKTTEKIKLSYKVVPTQSQLAEKHKPQEIDTSESDSEDMHVDDTKHFEGMDV